MKTIYVMARPVSRLEFDFSSECDRCQDEEEDQRDEEEQTQTVTTADGLPRPVGLLFVYPMLNFFDEIWYMFQKQE